MYHTIQYNEALKKIGSGDINLIIEGIKVLRDSGRPESVSVIVALLKENDEKEIKGECVKFLNDIKDQKATDYIVDEIKEKGNIKVLKEIVSSAWQSNLDYSMYLDVFTEVLLNTDYLIAFEAFTVIENNLNKLDETKIKLLEKKISNSLLIISEEKKSMVNELLLVIKESISNYSPETAL